VETSTVALKVKGIENALTGLGNGRERGEPIADVVA